MPEHNDKILTSEGVDLNAPEHAEKAWGEMIQHAPAMGRLPEMVAALYVEEMFDSAQEHKEELDRVDTYLRRGLLLYYDIMGPGMNGFFEHYDAKFGNAIVMTVDQIQTHAESSEGARNKYGVETLCGWLFGYIALEVCSEALAQYYERHEIPDAEVALNFYTEVGVNAPLLMAHELMNHITVDCPETENMIVAIAKSLIHTVIIELTEPSAKTTWH